jgi:hypothetical protein
MKEFNFEIKGNDVDDLLKVVNGTQSQALHTPQSNVCPICGTAHTTEPVLQSRWMDINNVSYTYNYVSCNNCNYNYIIK